MLQEPAEALYSKRIAPIVAGDHVLCRDEKFEWQEHEVELVHRDSSLTLAPCRAPHCGGMAGGHVSRTEVRLIQRALSRLELVPLSPLPPPPPKRYRKKRPTDPLPILKSCRGTCHASDDAGGTVVVDDGLCVVRIVRPGGHVGHIAGRPGARGCLKGRPTKSLFDKPMDVCPGPVKDSYYVSDMGNHLIYAIDAMREVTFAAGVPKRSGHRDDSWAKARFSRPQGMVADGNGGAIVCDAGNRCIRWMRRSGDGDVVETVCGAPSIHPQHVDGCGAHARFDTPTAIATTGDGRYAVTDGLRLRLLAPSDEWWTASTLDVDPALPRLRALAGVASALGGLLVSDPDSRIVFWTDLDSSSGTSRPSVVVLDATSSIERPWGLLASEDSNGSDGVLAVVADRQVVFSLAKSRVVEGCGADAKK